MLAAPTARRNCSLGTLTPGRRRIVGHTVAMAVRAGERTEPRVLVAAVLVPARAAADYSPVITDRVGVTTELSRWAS